MNTNTNAYRQGYEQGWKSYRMDPRMLRSYATNGTPEGNREAANYRRGQQNGRKNRTNGKPHKFLEASSIVGGMWPFSASRNTTLRRQNAQRYLTPNFQGSVSGRPTLTRQNGKRNLYSGVLPRTPGSRTLVPYNTNAYGGLTRQQGSRNLVSIRRRRNRRNRRNTRRN